MITITKAGREAILKGLIEDASERNPFINKNGKTYMRFDSIRFQLLSKGIRFSYFWRGEEMYWKDIDMYEGDTLTVANIEGRTEVNI